MSSCVNTGAKTAVNGSVVYPKSVLTTRTSMAVSHAIVGKVRPPFELPKPVREGQRGVADSVPLIWIAGRRDVTMLETTLIPALHVRIGA